MIKKNAISLIVLVITIIIITILATTVVVSISNSNIINKAKDAVNMNDLKQVQEFANLEWNSAYLEGARSRVELESAVLKKMKESNINMDMYDVTVTENGVQVKQWYGFGIKEEISITTSDQMYALGRILTTDDLRKDCYKNYESVDKGLEADLSLFSFPDTIATIDEKIEYLTTTSYKLENDVELKLLKNGYTSNLAIGSSNRPFKGYFNGNNKTILITESGTSTREGFGGIFGYVENATISNVNVKFASDINMSVGIKDTLGVGEHYIGMLVSRMKNAVLYNNNVIISEKSAKFVFDNASFKRSLRIGGVAGIVEGNSKIKKCSFILENNAQILISDTADEDNYDFAFGGIVARSKLETNERMEISDCNVDLSNSKIEVISPKLGYCAGVIADAMYTTIRDTNVTLKNSTMGTTSAGDGYSTLTYYYSLITGGLVGFARNGSSNENGTYGLEGVVVESSSFNSTNDTEKEVLFSKINKGYSPNVGGIIGIAFNNAVIKDTNVGITNGSFVAEKTGEDSYNGPASTCGGIIGRLEHTGVVKGCQVVGNNFNIMSRSTKREMYAGGIVGIDIGPYHKNVISLENNKFIGNNTSSITVELISGNAENRYIYVGGIAGQSAYIMKNCFVSGVTLYHNGVNTGAKQTAVGKLAGRFVKYSLEGTLATHFIPSEDIGIIGCQTDNVNIVINDNNSGIVQQGEEYGTNN